MSIQEIMLWFGYFLCFNRFTVLCKISPFVWENKKHQLNSNDFWSLNQGQHASVTFLQWIAILFLNGIMAEALKADRTKKKRAVTKQVNHLRQLKAEENYELIADEIEKLKNLFSQFAAVNEEYESKLEADEEIDECEAHFTGVQKDYIALLNSFRNDDNKTL